MRTRMHTDLRFYPHAICTTDAIYRAASEDEKTADKDASEGGEVRDVPLLSSFFLC